MVNVEEIFEIEATKTALNILPIDTDLDEARLFGTDIVNENTNRI